MKARRFIGLIFICSSFPTHADEYFIPDELLQLDLEALQNVTVSSVAKKSQRLYESAGSVYVISARDIERSGATNIPDLLRVVPGINVARIDSNKWAVSSRGFNGRLSNKLLVLVDGRTVYSPIFAGVFWSNVDTRLEDIDRIEVIRGPGETIWGANAVNGVINIITKNADASRGTNVNALAGSSNIGVSGSHTISKESSSLRLFGKGLITPESSGYEGSEPDDKWSSQRVGARWDATLEGGATLTLNSEVARASVGETNIVADKQSLENQIQHRDRSNNSGFAMARYADNSGKGYSTVGQFYVDYYRNEDVAFLISATTMDADVQHRRTVGNHEVMLGAGARSYYDKTMPGQMSELIPNRATHQFYNLLAQDEISTFGDKLRITIGNKFEYNDYSGVEPLPNFRMLWKINETMNGWLSISKSIRTPDRVERDISSVVQAVGPLENGNPFNQPLLVYVVGNKDFKLEQIKTYELGWRDIISSRWYVDISAFYNEYENGLTFDNNAISCGPVPQAFPCPGNNYLIVDKLMSNNLDGRSNGIEIVTKYTPDRWDIETSVGYFNAKMEATNGSRDTVRARFEAGSAPSVQANLKVGYEIDSKSRIDTDIRHVGRLVPAEVPAYSELDFNYERKLSKNASMNLVGLNLLHRSHIETWESIAAPVPAEVSRSAYVKINYSF